MKTLKFILGCLISAAFSIGLAEPPRRRLNALTDGRHGEGVLGHLKADAAIATRYLLVKRGSDADHLAVIAAASDEPLGLALDEPAAAEDPCAVALLGARKGTEIGVAQGTLAKDVDLYSFGDGTLTGEPTTVGTFWRVGKSVTASTVGLPIEFDPCTPQKLVVLAALTCTNGTAGAAADLAALKAEMELATDDLRRIAAAMATATLVKVLAA